MGMIKPAPRVHPFVAIMFNNGEHLTSCLDVLKDQLGEIFPGGPVYRVTDFTDYYVNEFGAQLQKQFYIFKTAVDLEDFHKIKIRTNELELYNSTAGTRRFLNIDPGYLEPSKLVLFSTKNFSHRTYCGNGIFAEVTMPFAHNDFVRLPWTYNDYYWDDNRRYLLNIRKNIVRPARSGRQFR